jgi:hypothetical protein
MSRIFWHFDLTRLGFYSNRILGVHTAEDSKDMALVAVCSRHKIRQPIIHIHTVLLAADINILMDCELNGAVK